MWFEHVIGSPLLWKVYLIKTNIFQFGRERKAHKQIQIGRVKLRIMLPLNHNFSFIHLFINLITTYGFIIKTFPSIYYYVLTISFSVIVFNFLTYLILLLVWLIFACLLIKFPRFICQIIACQSTMIGFKGT